MAAASSTGVSNFRQRSKILGLSVLSILISLSSFLSACQKKNDSKSEPSASEVFAAAVQKASENDKKKAEADKIRTDLLKKSGANLVKFHEQISKKSFQTTITERLKDIPVTTDLKNLKERLERAVSNSEIIYSSDACDVLNTASYKVMEKNLMIKVGHFLKHKEFKGQWHDSYRYEITLNDFMKN